MTPLILVDQISDADVVNYTDSKITTATNERQKWNKAHDENWRLYLNDYAIEDARKRPWQSKGNIPLLTDMVDRIVNLQVDNFLRARGNLFDCSASSRLLAEAAKLLVMEELEGNRFDMMLEDLLREVIISGYCVIKDSWDYTEGRMRLKSVDPLDFFQVPDGGQGFLMIEQITLERAELEMFIGDDAYDQPNLKAFLASSGGGGDKSSRSQTDGQQKAKAQGMANDRYAGLINPVKIYECWGRLYDAAGNMVVSRHRNENDPPGWQPNNYFTWIVGGGHVLTKPSENWYWDNASPYTIGITKQIKNSPAPASIITDHAVLQRSFRNLLCRIADRIFQKKIIWTYKKSQMEKLSLDEGIVEGRLYADKISGVIPGISAITPNITMDAEYSLLSAVKDGMSGIGMTDTGMGQAQAKSGETLGVAKMRMGGAMSFVSGMTRRLEQTALEGVIRRCLNYIVQFKLDSENNPDYSTNVMAFLADHAEGRDELINAVKTDGRKLLKTTFSRVRVHSMSDQISKEEKASGLNYGLRFLSQLIPALQGQMDPATGQPYNILSFISIPGLVFEAMELTGFTPRRILTPAGIRAVEQADSSTGTPAPQAQQPGMPPMPGVGAPAMAAAMRPPQMPQGMTMPPMGG